MRPLELGIFLDVFDGSDPTGRVTAAKGWHELHAFARRAETLGFDSLWVPDNLLWREDGGTGSTRGAWEAWSILAALAADTERIALGTLVACTAFRNPALLATMADTVEEINGGRLILGLGAGYHEPEFTAFGYPYDHRVSRFEEALTIITTLLRRGAFDFAGTYSQARLPAAPAGTAPRWAADPGGRWFPRRTAHRPAGSGARRPLERLAGVGALLARCHPAAAAAIGRRLPRHRP